MTKDQLQAILGALDKLTEAVAAIAAVKNPVVQAPAVQAPAVQAPAVQAPAVQAPAVQAPAVQAPVTREAVNAKVLSMLPEYRAQIISALEGFAVDKVSKLPDDSLTAFMSCLAGVTK